MFFSLHNHILIYFEFQDIIEIEFIRNLIFIHYLKLFIIFFSAYKRRED